MKLTLPNGRPIEIGPKELGKGAEGVVHEIRGTDDVCAKLYFDIDAELEERLDALKRHPAGNLRGDDAEHVHLAWPLERLQSADGRTRGFLMPRIEGERLIRLFEPDVRAQAIDEPTWRTLVSVAGRAARLVDTLHGYGIVLGDVSPANVLVNRAGLVTLIDCDTVQFTDQLTGRTFACRKLTPRYCPPDVGSGVSLATRHDDFALAILVCELLMEGEHPFDGVPSSGSWNDFNAIDNIRLQNNRIAFPERLVRIDGAITPAVLPPELLRLARTCFADGHWEPDKRPRASDWAAVLDRAEFDLMGCRSNANHLYHRSLQRCVWCERNGQGLGDAFPAATSTGGLRADPTRVIRVPQTPPRVPPAPAGQQVTPPTVSPQPVASSSGSSIIGWLVVGVLVLLLFWLVVL